MATDDPLANLTRILARAAVAELKPRTKAMRPKRNAQSQRFIEAAQGGSTEDFEAAMKKILAYKRP